MFYYKQTMSQCYSFCSLKSTLLDEKKQNKSAYNLLLYLFVRGRSNAIIRSTFSTEDRNGNEGGVCEGDDDGYYDKGLASGETSKARGKDMRREGVERRVEMMEGGSRALHLGANDF